ncbi:MAG: AmmeMemoRadiSam system protein A [Acidiferrobacterales bacterium]
MPDDRGSTLLALARNIIAARLGEARHPHADATWLSRPAATFVTLTRNEELRGCIGSLEATRTLRADVEDNALAAAFRDPRFTPLTRVEYADTRIEISLLSPPEPLPATTEQQAREILRPGLDGVVFEYGRYRSTFLPQVWEQLPEPDLFLSHLKRKAGLPPDFWHRTIRLSRYTVEKWREADSESTAGRLR